MNDPHVEALHYRFESLSEAVDFGKAEPLGVEIGDFRLSLADGILLARPGGHYASVEEARDACEPILRDWEAAAILSSNRYQVQFKFEDAEVIDRDPIPGAITVKPARMQATGHAPIAQISENSYPTPDPSFQSSPLAEELVYRLKEFRLQRQTLPSIANYVRSRIEWEFGGSRHRRPKAAKRLRIDRRVLDEIGRLAAVPDPKIGRKAGQNQRPLTPTELGWLEAAVVRLIWRVGELNAAGQAEALPQITMAGLPKVQS